MKKRIAMLFMLVLVLAMAGCGKDDGCNHEWADATCETPKICKLCDETEGEALGHSWEDATTEAPKTCTACQVTEGEKLQADDPRFTTAATRDLQGVWVSEPVPLNMGNLGLTGEEKLVLIYEFGNTGKMSISSELEDEASFRTGTKNLLVEMFYQEFSAKGLDRAAADEAAVEAYGMTLEAYAEKIVNQLVKQLTNIGSDMVYYVEGNKLYRGQSWNEPLEESEFPLENGVLLIDKDVMDATGEPLKWTRVED